MAGLARVFDRFFGRGEAAVTMPPMDGALRPNKALDTAEILQEVRAPDNLLAHRGEVLFTTGGEVRALATRALKRSFEQIITAAAAADDGRLAFGLENGRIALVDTEGRETTISKLGDKAVLCLTALAFQGQDLLVALGSEQHPPSQWKRDLMAGGAYGSGTGSVWRLRPDGSAACLADKLRYPYGLLPEPDGSIVVSESWRHRLLRIGDNGIAKPPLLLDLPGYPSRLSRGTGGAVWLAVFAPRSQLIEFVLREPGYRKRMINEVAPEYWVAPALASGRSFLEPLQGGAVKQMGILKPWAPARSYGLVLRLGEERFEPILSLHSRADGTRHGITSVLEHEGRLLVASRGGDVILTLPVQNGGAVPNGEAAGR